MSSRAHTGGLPASNPWSDDLSPTLVAAARIVATIKASQAKWITAGGRAFLVWLPCYTLTCYRFGWSSMAFAGSLLLASVWLI